MVFAKGGENVNQCSENDLGINNAAIITGKSLDEKGNWGISAKIC